MLLASSDGNEEEEEATFHTEGGWPSGAAAVADATQPQPMHAAPVPAGCGHEVTAPRCDAVPGHGHLSAPAPTAALTRRWQHGADVGGCGPHPPPPPPPRAVCPGCLGYAKASAGSRWAPAPGAAAGPDAGESPEGLGAEAWAEPPGAPVSRAMRRAAPAPAFPSVGRSLSPAAASGISPRAPAPPSLQGARGHSGQGERVCSLLASR